MTSYQDLADEFDVPVENVLSTFFLEPDTPTDTALTDDEVKTAREAWDIGASFYGASKSQGKPAT